MEHTPILRDTLIEIDLEKIAYNMTHVKAMAGSGVAVAAVIKADGYSHGAAKLAPVFMNHGAAMLAVATLSEAVELKEQYPAYPVLLMGLTPDAYLSYVADYDIIQTIDTLHQAKLLHELAISRGKKAKIHIKYDTGFHRLGFPDCKNSIDQIAQICSLSGLTVEGIFSHLALTDDESNERQMNAFLSAVNELERRGFHIPCKHIADSIAAVDYPQYRLSMVRVGALLYGLKGFHKGFLDVRQALTFKTRISHISELKKGEGVSYDYLWKAPADTRVGTLPFGYADGYPRSLRDKGLVTIRGIQAPIIGIICMDQCMVDLTGIPDAKIGDEVIIYGDGSQNTLDIEAISKLAGSNKNEIVCRLTKRPPRVYLNEREENLS